MVLSEHIFQCANKCSHHGESELAVVATIRIKINPKNLKQVVQFIADEVDVSARQRRLRERQHVRGGSINLVHHTVRQTGASLF
jgi:hypothetical protein